MEEHGHEMRWKRMDKKSNGKAMNGSVTYGKGIAKSRVAKMGIGMVKKSEAREKLRIAPERQGMELLRLAKDRHSAAEPGRVTQGK